MDALPVLYVIACGAPPTAELPALVRHTQAQGWDVCAILTPMATRFVDADELIKLTGHPVRVEYKDPADPDVLPPADALLVAPATFNTVNKLGSGITDTLATGLVCEGLGARRPTIIVPWANRVLSNYPAYGRNIHYLEEAGARLILTPRTTPGNPTSPNGADSFPWTVLHEDLTELRRTLTAQEH